MGGLDFRKTLTVETTSWVAVAAVLLVIATETVNALPGAGVIRVGGYSTRGDNTPGFQTYFVDRNCVQFQFSGWNVREMIELAAGTASTVAGKGNGGAKQGKTLIKKMFDEAEECGLKVCRFMGHGHSQRKLVLQSEAGIYNDEALAALDWVVAEAGARGLKLILTFADNWGEADGRNWYAAKFAGKKPMDFYTDIGIKWAYKRHVKFILNRRNGATGVRYRDNPTIFAWNLLNQPRCECPSPNRDESCGAQCAGIIHGWIEEMSAWVKQHDPKHMVVVGEEGFYSASTWKHWVNPDAFFAEGFPWARNNGQDSLADHTIPTIDYVGMHSWPDRWGLPGLWYQILWLREHINDAWWIGKPLVVEDFGNVVFGDSAALRRRKRDPFFQEMYRAFAESRKFNGPLKGVLFSNLDPTSAGPRPPSSVRFSDSTWTEIIKPSTEKLASDAKGDVVMPHCVPGTIRSLDAIFLDGTTVYYTTNGPHLVATSDWGNLAGRLVGVSVNECIDACEARFRSCRQFRFNPLLNGGTCVLRGNGRKRFKWSPEGWQTFFRTVGSSTCKDKKCLLCDQSFFPRCLKCKPGSSLILGDDHLPKCV